ncbi:MAG TPA: PhzF family phenazine biosynthesis protein [Pseudonocardiaceae bacterium]|jgi:PhzF family phenazine biosynthesis protein|nr:PhzF family phenazine biosynthesis protein [Pseudonocardiaceae bacterium]
MRLYVVDAFTDTAFAGNSAGVVLLERPADPAWMQSVAAELMYAETAFVEIGDGIDAAGSLPLRWFTPTTEVDLCGHATLATAHVLGGDRVFRTRGGELRCTAADGWVTMDFPGDPSTQVADDVAKAVTGALPGATVAHVLRGKFDLVAVLADAAEVRALNPDFAAILGLDARLLAVTAPGDRPGIDFVSRAFAPAVGIDEDPVTGSLHCTLAPYWSAELGRTELVGEQASARGGIVRVEARGDRIGLAGQAVTVLTGELHV